ncbi:MAG: biotin--[acetyl-CoA-carboxylase] ligase [Promethearchaeota archaeon]|jgi:BirA family biotin operon repressor/biotin-[acetyl-CoA-carboxylase] ligase
MFSKIKIVHINTTNSTQDEILNYLKNDYFPSILLIAKTQTSGRGRKEDDWFSPEGGFWATLGISTSSLVDESQLALFHYFTATLLARIIEEDYKLQMQVKWPNDILYENKKLAGILIDYVTSPQNNYILIGMGVNLNNSMSMMPEYLESMTISIKDILQNSVSLDDFAHKINFYANDYFSPIMDQDFGKIQDLINLYNRYSRIYGKRVILDDLKEYNCHGINKEGLMQFSNENSNLNLSIDDFTRVKKIIS